MAEKVSKLRQIALGNDMGDHGRDAQAGTPKTAANGQGAGGKYKPLEPQVTGGAVTVKEGPKPFKLKGG